MAHEAAAAAAASSSAVGGAGGPPIIRHIIPPGLFPHNHRNLSYITDNDTDKFRYFICCINGQLPRNKQGPVKKIQ